MSDTFWILTRQSKMSQVELIFCFCYPSAFLRAESFSFFVVFVSFFTAIRPLSMSYSFDLSGKMCCTT